MTVKHDAGAPLDTSRVLVGDLAVAVPVVSAAAPVAEVDRLFRRDSGLRAVIVADADAGASVLSRERLDLALTGPFGYGRSLHSRSSVQHVSPISDFVLTNDVSLVEAAERILARDPDVRYEDVLVGEGSHARVVRVARIFEQLALQLRAVAFHDPLTSLPNRRQLDRSGQLVSADGVDSSRIAVAYIDLDGFKLVNDSFGHRAGDDVLVGFAERLRACMRSQDVVSRVGGDEFAVLLTDVSDEQAASVADRILLSASTPFVVEDQAIFLSASIGLVMGSDVTPPPGTDLLDSLLRAADSAMLHAKRTGKGRVERMSAAVGGDALLRRGLLRRKLGEAVTHGQGLSLVYQPTLNLATGISVAVEALLRWTDPELGSIPTPEFIGIAEETDQINRLGRWVLNEACAQARRWLSDGQPRIVSVNVSPVQLRNPDFVQVIKDALIAWDLPPEYLRIEITETAAVLDMPATITQLKIIRRLGVDIELDDFGIGFSGLSLLRDLPLTTVKIDRSFINRIDVGTADAAMVKGVIDSAHALGLTVTAEGVERPEQLAVLRELGADTVQGYLIAWPATAARLDTTARPGHAHPPTTAESHQEPSPKQAVSQTSR